MATRITAISAAHRAGSAQGPDSQRR